jgi:hypothetical protein
MFVNNGAARSAVNPYFCFTQANSGQIGERFLSSGFHYRRTISCCILTEERKDKISGLETSPGFLA